MSSNVNEVNISNIDTLFSACLEKDKILQKYLLDVQNPDLASIDLSSLEPIEALFVLSMKFLEMNSIWLAIRNSTNSQSLSNVKEKVHWVASITHQRVQQAGNFDSKIHNALSEITASPLAVYTYNISRAARIALEYIDEGARKGMLEPASSYTSSSNWIQQTDSSWSYSAEIHNPDEGTFW